MTNEVIFDIEAENLDNPFEREKLESLPKAILVELLVRKIKIIGKALEWFDNADRRGLNELFDILKGVDKE